LLKIMLSATEVSGDLHGANLVRAIKKICPECEFLGVGGERMREEGVDVRIFSTHLGTVGVVEGVKFYPFFLRIISEVKRLLKEEKPDLLVLIDSRDFNLKLIPLAERLKVPTVYYVAPPVWAWPDWKMKKMSRKINKIIAIFPFEEKIYKKAGADVVWVGHPLLDVVKPALDKKEAFKKFSLDPSRPVIGLLPGSREQEIKALLPLMLKAAENIKKKLKEVQYLLPVASFIFQEKIAKMVGKSKAEVKILNDNIYDLMNISSLLITASGTATLEAACLGIPMVIVYKTHITTYLLGKVLLTLPYVGLPNILAGRRIVPELLQFKATEKNLSDTVLSLLSHSGRLARMRHELKQSVKKLGPPGATERAARVIVEEVKDKGLRSEPGFYSKM